MAIDHNQQPAEEANLADDGSEGSSNDPGLVKLPAVLNFEVAADILATVRNAVAAGAAVSVDASEVDRLHTPVAQILVSAAKSCDLAIRAPSEEFVASCVDLGIWPLLSERIEA